MASNKKERTVEDLLQVKENGDLQAVGALKQRMEEIHRFLLDSGAVIETPLAPYPYNSKKQPPSPSEVAFPNTSHPPPTPFEIYMKLENLQPVVKSFKVRAAMSALRTIPHSKLGHGVAAPSAGNFAAGLVSAIEVHSKSTNQHIPLTFLVPSHTSPAKTLPLQEKGATVLPLHWEDWWTLVQTQDLHSAIQKHTISTHNLELTPLPCFLHPVVDTNVILGNASIGVEILMKHPDCDAIVVPVGGGALITGICVAVRLMQDWNNPRCKVYAVEVETAAPLGPSMRAGKPVSVPYTSTWIDGMGSGQVLSEIWPFLRDWVEESLIVSVDEVASAVTGLVGACSVVAEGAGAAPLAAITKHQNYLHKQGIQKVVGVVSGGRISTTTLAEILEGGNGNVEKDPREKS